MSTTHQPAPRTDFVIDREDFNQRIVGAYNSGTAEKALPADITTVQSLIPAGTGVLRDFSYIAPEIPKYIPENCVGCMECVTECPDTAILGKVIEEDQLEKELAAISDPALREHFRSQFVKTQKYHTVFEKKTGTGGLFGIFIDPTKCKGCAECVTVCDDNALEMIRKTPDNMTQYRSAFEAYKQAPETPGKYINEKVLADMMLAGKSLLYVGGAGSCMGCGEATAIRMMLAATGFVYGPDQVGVIASTGCNTVYSSTYPYNPFLTPWANSLFENGPTFAMGVRAKWDQDPESRKKVMWLIGGDGAMLDIGFQALSRMLLSGMNIKVLVLDTQVYSNTGGQASTGSFHGQEAKMSAYGKEGKGKKESRKELGTIAMMHPNVFVAQTTAAHINHFYRAVMAANEFDGPAVLSVYTTCQPEHGVGDNMASTQARLAVDTRAFPLFVYDPRKGKTFRERLSLQGNPNPKDDWYTNPKTNEPVTFIDFARSEGRFAKQFGKEGEPSPELLETMQNRLENWHMLQELAGLR
ncbi:MAG: 4Fe-4S binding protein [Bacteroidetes bacterium]|nr:4Fe-4S binding protein [Bacteroidota bacterium]